MEIYVRLFFLLCEREDVSRLGQRIPKYLLWLLATFASLLWAKVGIDDDDEEDDVVLALALEVVAARTTERSNRKVGGCNAWNACRFALFGEVCSLFMVTLIPLFGHPDRSWSLNLFIGVIGTETFLLENFRFPFRFLFKALLTEHSCNVSWSLSRHKQININNSQRIKNNDLISSGATSHYHHQYNLQYEYWIVKMC